MGEPDPKFIAWPLHCTKSIHPCSLGSNWLDSSSPWVFSLCGRYFTCAVISHKQLGLSGGKWELIIENIQLQNLEQSHFHIQAGFQRISGLILRSILWEEVEQRDIENGVVGSSNPSAYTSHHPRNNRLHFFYALFLSCYYQRDYKIWIKGESN